MAKKTFKTGEVIVQSGIYKTPSKKTPEITLSKGDKVPPVGGQSGQGRPHAADEERLTTAFLRGDDPGGLGEGWLGL